MAQLILGQLKFPKRMQSGRCVMSLVKVHKRVGLLGLRYASTRTVSSDLFWSSHAIRFTNRGEGMGRGGVISCGERLDFT